MSLLRACRTRPTLNALAYVRGLTTNATAQTQVTAEKSESTQIAEPVHHEVFTADIVSGAPVELRHRAVRIYQPTRNTMQSGSGKSERWRIDWDVLQGAGRWENPLMGWASSADYMQGTRLSFRSKEDAIHFAEKQGWDYYVQPETVKRIPPKNYAENFVYKPHKLRIMRTK
ncbi:ETC complex I subunit conserved region domain containing protein [Tylopilus felleus]